MQMRLIGRRRRRQLLIALALAAVAAGAIVASVSAHDGPRRHGSTHARAARARAGRRGFGERALAARYLGLSRAQLREKLRSGRTLAQIADATSGKSAAGLIETLVKAGASARRASTHRRIALAVGGVRGYAARAASSYLGMSRAELRHELRSGHSLAQLAQARSGKSAAGLIAALLGARQAQVRAALAAGALSQAEADSYLSNLRERVTRHVERTRHHGPKAAQPAG